MPAFEGFSSLYLEHALLLCCELLCNRFLFDIHIVNSPPCAQAVVSTYMDDLRRRSTAMSMAAGSSSGRTSPALPNIRAGSLRSASTAAGGGMDLRSIAGAARAAVAGGGVSGSPSGPHESRSSSNSSSASREDARVAVANYMEVSDSNEFAQ